MMKRYFTLIVLFSLFMLSVSAQYQGSIVLEDLSVSSKIMSGEVNYSLYLPPDYSSSTRFYPVVYLLHGYTDDDSGWIQFGEMKRIVDEAITSGKIPPMIIIMPDGGVSWYTNDAKGKVRWDDMFVEEFIPQIEKKYRIRNTKEYRGIAGLSMGGFGSLHLSMNHPELFIACAAFSAALRTDEQMISIDQNEYDPKFGILYGEGLSGKERLTDHYYSYSPLFLTESLPVEDLLKVRYYFDCGDDDYLTIGNAQLHILMTEKGIPHEYRSRDGKHQWHYWRTGLVDGLKFIGESFRR